MMLLLDNYNLIWAHCSIVATNTIPNNSQYSKRSYWIRNRWPWTIAIIYVSSIVFNCQFHYRVNFCAYHLLLPPVNEVWGKVMFLHLYAILFIGGGVSAPLHAGIQPQADTPHVQTPPSPDTTGYGVSKRVVRILLECILVAIVFLVDLHPIYHFLFVSS